MRVETFGTEALNPFGADRGRCAAGLRRRRQHHRFAGPAWCSTSSSAARRSFRCTSGCRSRCATDNQYPLFSELIPIRVSTAPGQWHRYGISDDRAHDRVEWRVDGAVVAERTAVGAPPGERGPIVKIEAIKIGGGLFTMLGDRNSDRVRTGDGKTIPDSIPQYERTLFGQGARVEFGPFLCRP